MHGEGQQQDLCITGPKGLVIQYVYISVGENIKNSMVIIIKTLNCYL